MVDEFQDTDPVQWDILRRAFAGHATLVLIGDPKQAIYAFRGADVFSYLDAVGQADQVATLATNWRSDAALVAALDALMGGAALGDERIVVRPVARSPPASAGWLSAATTPDPVAPVRLRVLPHDPADAETGRRVGTCGPQIARRPGRRRHRRCSARTLRLRPGRRRAAAGAAGRHRRPGPHATSAARRSATRWSRPACRR